LPSTDQIPAELIETGDEMLRSWIHKLINFILNKEELPEQLKQTITVPVYNKGDKTDCSDFRGISLLSTLYRILPYVLLSRLNPYVDEIIEDNQCGFRR
jgi:hypothetical protein